MGTFKVELFLDQMPLTASNWIDLAKSGFYAARTSWLCVCLVVWMSRISRFPSFSGIESELNRLYRSGA